MIGSVFVFILILISTPAWATTYYVGKSGSNSNSCATAQSSTAGNRKLTITGGTGGLACLSGGDTLIIGNGVYDESIAADTIPNGSGPGGEAAEATWSGATVIQAETTCTGLTTQTPTCTTTLKPSVSTNCAGTAGNNTNIRLTDGSAKSYIIFRGFEADANQFCVHNARWFHGASSVAAPHHIRAQNVYWHNTPSGVFGAGAISVGAFGGQNQAASHHIEVLDSVIRDRGANPDNNGGGNYCIYSNASGTVRRNIFKNCGNDGNKNGGGIITHSGDGGYTMDVSANDLDGFGYFGIEVAYTTGMQVYNNIVRNGGCTDAEGAAIRNQFCAGIGINGNFGPTNSLIANNTIYNIAGGNGGGAIAAASGSSNTTIQNNILYGGNHDTIPALGDGGTIGNNRCSSGCLTSDNPLFTDASAGNFHLVNGSTMVGVGAHVTAVTTDKDGLARPSGNYTIGAYEGTAGSSGVGGSFSDQFNRANNTDLNTDWTPTSASGVGPMQIVNNMVRPTSISASAEEIVMAIVPNNDQYAKFLIPTFTSGGVYGDVRAIVRALDPAVGRQFYVCFAEKNYAPSTSEIALRTTGGGYTTLASSSSVTWGPGDSLECRAVGTTISLYRTPSGSSTATLVLSVTNSTLTGGRIGMGAFDAGAVSNLEIDNFNSGDYPPASSTPFPNFPIATDFPSVAVLDNFDRANSGSLGANWTVVSGGGFTIASNQAAAPASTTENLYTGTQLQKDHEVYATWTTIPACCGYTTLIDFAGTTITANSQYKLQINRVSGGNAFAKVISVDSGGSTTGTPNAEVDLGGDIVDGNSFGVRVSGTTISAYWKYSDGIWYRIGQGTDVTLPTGSIYGGISGASPAVVNDFGAGPLVTQPTQTPPSPTAPSVGAGRLGPTFPSR